MTDAPRRSLDAYDVLERISDGCVILDAAYRFLCANPAGLRDMRKTMDDIVGRVHWDVFPASYHITAGQRYRAALETKVPQHFTEHYAYEGLDLHMEMSAYPTDAGGVAVFWKDVTDRVRAEALLRESEQRSRLLFRDAPVPMFLFDQQTLRFLDVNAMAMQAYGYSYDEFLAMTLRDIRRPDAQAHLDGVLAESLRRGGISHATARHVTKSGVDLDVEISMQQTEYNGRPARVVMVVDVSERLRAEAAQRELEDRLRQSQKMEAVGQLAGGIAHDFNNLLTVIVGNLDFVREGIPPRSAVRDDLEEIATAAERARTLVRQLLTFSRKQQVQPRLVHVGEVVRGMQQLLRRVIGEEIAMEVVTDPDTAAICIDPGQLEQVVMNLVVNARYALLTPGHGFAGGGGVLTVEVRARDLPAGTDNGRPAGAYVALIVRDTGHGMDAHTREHLFEPFFTTKEVGTGTGLGLATVHGIVQQAGGRVEVESAPGRGTTFTVLLPVAGVADTPAPTVSAPTVSALAGLTVLLAEDEAPVRAIVRRMLEHHGARVLEARHGRDALALWSEHRDAVRVVVTDLRMPELGGRELVAELRARGASLRVLYLSGYTEGAPLTMLGPEDQFAEKPFTTESLTAALHRLLAPTRP